jgi:hypothetical protein
MKTERRRMDETMPQPGKILQGPGFASTAEKENEDTGQPSFLEQQLHNAGYLVMPNQPPPKFWSWANIGNIGMILMAMAALGYWLWNTAIDVGVQRERNRVNEEIQKKNASDIDKLYKLVAPEAEPTPEETPKTRSKK